MNPGSVSFYIIRDPEGQFFVLQTEWLIMEGHYHTTVVEPQTSFRSGPHTTYHEAEIALREAYES